MLRDTKTSGKQLLPSNYRPELELSDELNPEFISRYLPLIIFVQWAVKLGRINILFEVAIMLQYLASPQIGNLKVLYNIFGYFKKHEILRIVFDPKELEVDQSLFAFATADWSDFYVNVEEDMPLGIPEPFGKRV